MAPKSSRQRRPAPSGPRRSPNGPARPNASLRQKGGKPGRLKKRTPVPATDASTMRLQKFLAAAGVGSRRDCEVLIVEGRIEVDNQVVTELGTRIDPETQVVTFDGQRVRSERLQYFMLNKPPGVVSTAQDPSGRTRVVDLISSHQRVYNVGRLDKSSEGLILVTNDGTLAQYLTHPSFGVEKIYQVLVRGVPKFEDLQTLKHGVHLMEGVAKVKDVDIRRRHKDSTELTMVLDEGKNREIRRMLAKIGHKVVRLVRVGIGPLALGDLPQGAHRRLTHEEITELKDWAERVAKGQSPRTVLGPKAKRAARRVADLVATPKPSPRSATDKSSPPAPRSSSNRTAGNTGTKRNTGTNRKSREHDTPAAPVNPVAEKLASGRPIHLEDVQRAKEIRSQANSPSPRSGPAASGPKRSGPTRSGPKPSGPKRSGPKRSGGKPRPGSSRPASAAPGRAKPGRGRPPAGKATGRKSSGSKPATGGGRARRR